MLGFSGSLDVSDWRTEYRDFSTHGAAGVKHQNSSVNSIKRRTHLIFIDFVISVECDRFLVTRALIVNSTTVKFIARSAIRSIYVVVCLFPL